MKKILEEIEIKIAGSMGKKREGLLEAHDIIRKHMNDGWIPVEKRPPEDFEEVLVTDTGGRVRLITFNKFLFNHPEYTHEVKVIAWRPLPEPYRLEKGAEE